MFTGIIEATGIVQELRQRENEWRLRLDTGKLPLSDVGLGDSIAVSGCCLTVVELHPAGFSADVSRETLRCTTLGEKSKGDRVNLEKAMRADARFGGHLVSGHVDGIGSLLRITPEGRSVRLEFELPRELSHYVAAKGSICIDGTSLTVNTVSGDTFSVNIIPHTQEETVIGGYAPGGKVNIEVDLIARYLERLLQGQSAEGRDAGISREFLERHGFESTQ